MIEFYEVGGCVRDELLGVKSKDIDYTVVAPSFAAMREWLTDQGFVIFVETPEFLTIRARFPRSSGKRHFMFGREVTGLTADFVLARKEGVYYDGRHPESVEPGTLLDDLQRRDFTINSIAKDIDGNYIDPFYGRGDLTIGVLRCVGNAEDRIREDPLRALRAVRFYITKGLTFDIGLEKVLQSTWLPDALRGIVFERRRDELYKAFKEDTERTLDVLYWLPSPFRLAALEGLWLKPTNERGRG